MAKLPSYAALRARFDQHLGAASSGHPGQNDAVLAAALRAIGWRAAGEDAVELVALYAIEIVDACAYGHRSVPTAARDLADLMRKYAPRHSDFLAPIEDFIPAAEEVLRLYVEGVVEPDIMSPPG